MTFLWPTLLWLLFLVPILIGAYLLAQQLRKKYALRYASVSLVREALGRGPGIRRHVPAALFLTAVALLLLALARPAAIVTLPSQESTIVLVMDVSGSMRAEDMQPNRMEAAQAAAKAFVEKQRRGVKIGVVTFSSHAAVVQEPTVDHEKALSAIERLRTQRGTAIGSAILTALDTVLGRTGEQALGADIGSRDLAERLTVENPIEPGSHPFGVIVLLSDGQSNQGPDPLEVVDRTAGLGVRIFTIGMGTPAGSVIGVEGRSIRVSLDEEVLTTIARQTGAQYFRAGTETDLREVYENLSTRLVMETQKTELTALFAAAAILLLVAAGTLSILWLNRLP
jgi:Ca-activated chloride channel family protein